MPAIKSKSMNIRTTEQEYDAIKAYAEFKGETVSSLILNAFREQIEEWEDIKDAEKVLSRNEPKSSWADVKKRAGL